MTLFAYGIISFYTYQNNLESYERRLISIENSQKKLSPNSENITSHNHILDAISTSIKWFHLQSLVLN